MYGKYIKRLLDIVIALLGLPLLILVLLVLTPIIYFTDKGPVFYNAPRLGKNGRIFKMYKLRSMTLQAPDIRNEDGSTYNAINDPRVTPIGRFIRKTSLDEAPQLLNVLKGDMSVVGPRPDLPEHIRLYDGTEAGKLAVRPGITGYSQAYVRNSVEWKKRLEGDVYYIQNISFLLDIRIFIKTAITVLSRENIYSGGNGEPSHD